MSTLENTFTLAIATAGQGSTVVVRGPNGMVIRHNPEARGQDGYLIPLVQAGLAEAGVVFADLTRIGVVTGPGSFTGLRVGLAAARGLALALDIPIVGVSAFDLYRAVAGGDPIVALDTLRGDVFSAGDGLAPAVRTLEDLQSRLLVGNIASAQDFAPEVLGEALLTLTEQADPIACPPEPLYLRAPEIKTSIKQPKSAA